MSNPASFRPFSAYVKKKTVSVGHLQKESLSLNCLNSSVSSFSSEVMTHRSDARCVHSDCFLKDNAPYQISSSSILARFHSGIAWMSELNGYASAPG